MTKIIEAKEVVEIDNYIDFKVHLEDFIKNKEIEKAVKLYEEYFVPKNLFSLSDISLVDSLKHHLAIIINRLVEISIDNDIPSFIAYAKGQTLIRILSQKSTKEECIMLGRIAIVGFGQQIALSEDVKNNDLILDALFYIHEHLDEKISLQEVADYVHLARNYFSTLFKNSVHMSFSDYINYSKINRSKYYLAHTSKNVSEISEILGFGSQGYFINIFKKYSGCTPKDYQSKWNV